MLGKDVPTPVPECTKIWGARNGVNGWGASSFIGKSVDEWNQDEWYAVPIQHRDFDIHNNPIADSTGYEPVPKPTLDPKGEIGKTKAPMWLLPSTALIETAWAHKDGADKYGAYNFRHTQVYASTYISAMMRHWTAYLDGEDRATDSGCHHLAHIVANCNILMDAARCGTLVDDRPKSP